MSQQLSAGAAPSRGQRRPASNRPSPRLAYVVSGVLGEGSSRSEDEGVRPRAEYEEIVRQTGGSLIGLNHARSSNPLLHRLAPKRSVEYVLMALFLRDERQRHTHFIFSGEDIGVPAALALWRRTDPPHIVITIHGFYFENKKFRMLVRLIAAMRNVRFVCLSKSVRCRMIDRFGADPSRCHNVGYFADTSFFSPLPRSNADVVIASAGLSQRDYGTLIAATSGLPLMLKIAAASQWIGGQEVAADLPSNVEMRSYGTYPKLRQLYADSAIVVVPLRRVSFAAGYAVIAEAMAMGRPVIVSETDAPPDFVEHGRNALVVPPGDPAALRSAILSLLSDRGRAEQLGLAARESMANTFNIEAYCRSILAIAEVH